MFHFQKYQRIAVCTLIVGLSFCHQSFAASGPKISLYGGSAFVQTTHSNLVLDDTETDTLTHPHKRSTQFEFGGGLAYNVLLAPEDLEQRYLIHSISFGVDTFRWQAQRKGLVLLFGDPTLADYHYTMPLKSTSYLANTEINIHPVWGIMPFVELGAGIAHNKIGYHDNPQPGIPSGQVHLHSKSMNNFAYDLGAGLKVAVTDHVELSLRYLYANLHSAKTSRRGTINVSGTEFPIVAAEPVTARLRTQSVLLGLSYLIN